MKPCTHSIVMSVHICVTTFADFAEAYKKLVFSSYYSQLHDRDHSTLMAHDHISIVSVQLPHTTKVAHENGQGGYQNQSSTQFFSDM